MGKVKEEFTIINLLESILGELKAIREGINPK